MVMLRGRGEYRRPPACHWLTGYRTGVICTMSTRPKERARTLRQRSTDAENKLWAFLRDRRLAGYKFCQQHPIGPYLIDFVCLVEKLIIELDGGQHTAHFGYDEQRTSYLSSLGYRVVRYWNHKLLLEPEQVLDDVLRHLQPPRSRN
jgi:very-short-patch-repair endonuclease